MGDDHNNELQPAADGRYDLGAGSTAIQRPDGRASYASDCGDALEFFIRVKDWNVDEVGFTAHGCGYTVLCIRAAVSLARGKPLGQAAQEVTPEAISGALGGLPDENFHTAEFVADTLTRALLDAIQNAREPWRRLYGR